ncbi:efflux RND transporter periplasmic adaptor subunit [Diaphorobacter sp. JS3050]|uniref:efflux RND transporter periplasmic adaptor subunit n=1 Tax=Diaphorobacter sp. JS3050 TaxID=2735554 RepID=UPI001557F480|nr:efflux RND transporter periplasmic adaptor subunit [Diaphorobacter sp. JS3050]QJY31802.1 efflux RND transporter periplasmic adaptor subunit [Diaphorobacter sp. JS3050]
MPLLNHAMAPTIRQAQRTPAIVSSLALAGVLTLSACGQKNDAGGAPAQPPTPEVGVVAVQASSIGLVTELPGRLEASRVAQVRARAAGILQKRVFTEGSDVKAGQVLFQIDSAPYQASLAQAEASVAQAEASLAQSRALAERYRPLVAVNAISKQEYDNAVAAQKTAEANVAAAKAALTTSRINLGYATVTAPISGRIGRALVTEGALVGQGTPTELAVIQQIDPLYINFTQSASEAIKLKAAMASGKYKQSSANAANVRVVLEDGIVYPQTGRLLFTDLTVDATSGQVTLRAEVPNPERALLPGLYVRVRLEQAQVDNGILLPQQAVTRSGKADTVLVVGPDNQVTPRVVKLGPAQGSHWVVLDGLKSGEQVMVDGFQKLPRGKPGDPIVVKPVAWQAAGAAQQPATAPASAAPANPASAASSQPAPAAAKQ